MYKTLYYVHMFLHCFYIHCNSTVFKYNLTISFLIYYGLTLIEIVIRVCRLAASTPIGPPKMRKSYQPSKTMSTKVK